MARARLRDLGRPAGSRRTALAACIGLAFFVGGCAEEVVRSSLPISDDFSGECAWSQDAGGGSVSGLPVPGGAEYRCLAIVRNDETDEQVQKRLSFQALIDQRRSLLPGRTNRIRGECRRTEDGVELTMYLDGRGVGTARDRNGFGSFEAFGFVVISSEPGTDVRFDDFEADPLAA